METTQYAIAGIFLAIGLIVSLLNWVALGAYWFPGRHSSMVPLVGAVCLGTGALFIPDLRSYAWLAVLCDFGTLVFLFALPSLVRELWVTSRFNLLEEYVGRGATKIVSLRLFRRGVFILRWEFQPPIGEPGLVEMGQIGEWERDGDVLVLRIGEYSAHFQPRPDGNIVRWFQQTGFSHLEVNPAYSLDGLEFVLRV